MVTPCPARIGLNWRIGGTYGWGVFGLNLAVELARTGAYLPVPLLEPMSLETGVLQTRVLARGLAEQRALAALTTRYPGRRLRFEAPVLHALMGDVVPIQPSPFTGSLNAGLIFFENTRFSGEGLARAAAYDCIVAGSAWNAEVLRGLGLSNVVLARQGVDPTLFHPAPRAGYFPGRFVVFSGGKLEYRKGQDIVVVAFRRFHERHPDTLLLSAWQNPFPQLGIDMPAGGYVEADPRLTPSGLDIAGWLAENGLPEGSFIDCGLVRHHELAPLLREADVAVFPNRAEGGTNLVAMEAMACGVPCVLSANTGHLDLLAEGACYPLTRQCPVRSAARFPATEGWGESDVDEVVAALEAVYADREEAQRRGREGAQLMAGWSWSHQTAHLLRQLPLSAGTPSCGTAPLLPPSTEALFCEALDHHRRGAFSTAAPLYARLAAVAPELEAPSNNLRLLLHQAVRQAAEHVQAGAFAQGRDLGRLVLQYRGGDEDAWRVLGVAGMRLGRWDEARCALEKALALEPDRTETHLHCMDLAIGCGRFAEAIRCLSRAIHLGYGDGAAAHRLGASLLRDEEPRAAGRMLRMACLLDPAAAAAWTDLGTALEACGMAAQALAAFRRGQSVAPDLAEAHWGEAKARLMLGDFDGSWSKFAWRRSRPTHPARQVGQPLWRGEELPGRTVMIFAEIGFGDTILGIRFVPWVAQRCGAVAITAPPGLVRLLTGMPGLSACTALEGAGAPAFDAHCSVLDLPAIFGAPPAPGPEVPYLHADPILTAAWRSRLAALPRLRVGLVWAADPRKGVPADHAMNRRRSLPLAAFAPLGTIRGVSFISLQKGEPAAEAYTSPSGLALFDAMDEVMDFADTAALIANLDLVLTVDTAVAHLAGAMGAQVWMLSRFDAGFPWQIQDTGSTVWYPTMRIFRQPAPGDWASVLRRVGQELEVLVG